MKIHPDYKTISVTRIIVGAIILSTLAVTNIYLYKTLIEYKQILEFTTQENKDLQAKYLEARKELDRPLHYIDMVKLNEIVAQSEPKEDTYKSYRDRFHPGSKYVSSLEEIQTDGHFIKIVYNWHYIDGKGNSLENVPGYYNNNAEFRGKILKDGSIELDYNIDLPKTFVPYYSPYFEKTKE